MKQQFTYVIAPDGCTSYLTPGKKYAVIGEISHISCDAGVFFSCSSDINTDCQTTSERASHLNGKDWIIPEIGQWPKDWDRHKKLKCLQKAGVEVLTTGFMQLESDYNKPSPEGSTDTFNSTEYQGRTPKQLEGGYKIMAICFIAFTVFLVIAAILKACS